MQKRRIHMVVVTNNKNRVVGLTTMEDILEEIHGEIYDETDYIKELLQKQKKK